MVAKRVTIYLDNSALNRPFDDQSQARVADETKALESIMRLVFAGEVDLACSWVGNYENIRSRWPERRVLVDRMMSAASARVDEIVIVRDRGRELERAGLKPFDALHLAAAEMTQATWFISCDDRLRRRYNGKLRVATPPEFLHAFTMEPP